MEQTPPRSNAREKLTRLSKQQFTELSTDVYDELMRRQNNAKNQPFLAVRDEFHPKRNQARQKLATLPKNRFKDLASDVFFELERRFPELKEEFRPDAIAREKEREQQMRDEAEAALQRKDSMGPPQPSTSDRIVPAMSTLVEEDIAVPYKSGNRSNDVDGISERVSSPLRDSIGSNGVNGLADNRSTMYSQASSVGTGFFNGYTGSIAAASPNLSRASAFESSDASSANVEKMRSDYELRIAKLQQQVSSLEVQIAESAPRARKADELAGRNEELDRQLVQLRKELDEAKQRHEEDRERHRTITTQKETELLSIRRELLEKAEVGGQADFEALQKDHAQQTEMMDELKEEVSNLLEELRELSARNDEMQADRDNDVTVIKDLNAQMANYKRLYEAAKTELRNLKATSQLYVQPPKADDFLPASDKGAIADVNLTAFQSSIDELLAAARSKTPGNVLLSMKTVVLSTTLVTDDVSKYEQIPANLAELSQDEQEQLMALKSKCSATLNNLMTACRNHASSHGLSPVSLLDAAASHVSATIVDLVKLLKVRKASKVEADEFQATFEEPAATRLKPLHINAQSANREVSATLSPNTANNYSFASLNPISAANGDDRFSPRIRNSPLWAATRLLVTRPKRSARTREEITTGAAEPLHSHQWVVPTQTHLACPICLRCPTCTAPSASWGWAILRLLASRVQTPAACWNAAAQPRPHLNRATAKCPDPRLTTACKRSLRPVVAVSAARTARRTGTSSATTLKCRPKPSFIRSKLCSRPSVKVARVCN